MEFMIIIRYPNEAPSAYFFSDAPTANRFFYSKFDAYAKGTLLEGTRVQLWRMAPSGRSWELKLSND